MNRSSSPFSRRYVLAAAVLAASMLGGCATVNHQTPEKVVGERAQQRWDVLLKSDYGTAYDYLSPAQRAISSRQSYINRFGEGVKWLSAKLQTVSCESPERCSAVLQVKTLVLAPGFSTPITTKVTEIWVKDEGNWWFYGNP